MRGAWGAVRVVTAVTAVGGCQPAAAPARSAPQPAALPPLVAVPSATASDPEPAAPSLAVANGLPPVPRLSERPLMEGSAYTVWGASYSLRHAALRDTIAGQVIEVRGFIGKTNLMDAPKCAVHPPGVADPPGCRALVPAFWICDDRNDDLADCIQVMGWASNYAQLHQAIQSCAADPPLPIVDAYWGRTIACPIPAAGAEVTVTGTYSTTFTRASSGVATDPLMGILASDEIETRRPPPAPARLP